MDIKKLLFILILIFPLWVDALSLDVDVVTDYSSFDPYGESTITELYDNTNGLRIYCLDHGLPACNGCAHYYSYMIWEGPACALVYYPSSSSGTTNYHNRIRYIQYYGDSSFSCSRYSYNSGFCDSNNKNAVDDEDASISVSQNGEAVLNGDYYVTKFDVLMSGSAKKYIPTINNSVDGVIITTSEESFDNVLSTEIDSSVLYLKIPSKIVGASLNVSLNVQSSYTTTCNYWIPGLSVFKPNVSNASSYQRMSYADWKTGSATKTFTKSSSVNAEVTSVVGTIKITKLDEDTQKPLEGVKFKLYTQDNQEAKYADGTLVGELTTNVNGQIVVENLVYDSYLIREISTLPEYIGQSEDALVILDKNYVEITITNDPIVVKISKLDLTSHNEVEGATIVIKDNSGNIIETWVSTKEVKQFYVAPGKYSLEETIAPNGYNRINTIFEFIVHEDGIIELLDDENKYLELEEGTLILYNDTEEIVVPDTADSMNYVLIGIGVLSIGFGAYFIYKGRKKNMDNSL